VTRLPDKTRVREALRTALAATLETAVRVAADSAAGATHEESRQEGLKDMRATEQSYIARGQAMRAEALAEELDRFDRAAWPAFGDDDPVAAGALLLLEVDGEERRYLLSAFGAGVKLAVDGAPITVVTPASPVGRALLGVREGDDVEVRMAGRTRELVVLEVA
jgi:transcription elongation GreA/GreB family factor